LLFDKSLAVPCIPKHIRAMLHMRAMLARCNAAGRAACSLVGLVAQVAEPCTVFTAAFWLCLWALGREDETPADVLTACREGTPGCVVAALWHSRDVFVRLFVVSFYLFCVVLRHSSEEEEDADEGLQEQMREESRRQASASTRERLVRCPPRFLPARETTAEQVRKMAPRTARPALPVLPETSAVAKAQQPSTGRSAVSPQRAPSLRSASQRTEASRSRFASPPRSTGPSWNLRDAVRVSLWRRKGSWPPEGARRASKDPTGQRRSSVNVRRSRGVVVSSGSLFYENVVLRQLREVALRG
jgi:hypothetical protein